MGVGVLRAAFSLATSRTSTSAPSHRDYKQTTAQNWWLLSWQCERQWLGQAKFLVWLSTAAWTIGYHCGKLASELDVGECWSLASHEARAVILSGGDHLDLQARTSTCGRPTREGGGKTGTLSSSENRQAKRRIGARGACWLHRGCNNEKIN